MSQGEENFMLSRATRSQTYQCQIGNHWYDQDAIRCGHCGEAKEIDHRSSPPSSSVSSTMSRPRGNEWICPDCGNNVYASKNKCGKCGKWKPGNEFRPPVIKEGDWKCPCGFPNYASRKECLKCKAAAPGGPIAKKEPEPKPGDWPCLVCKKNNFGNRTACFGCGLERSYETKSPTCVVCLDKSTNTLLETCNHICMCYECSVKLNTCPLCRVPYNPQGSVRKVVVTV